MSSFSVLDVNFSISEKWTAPVERKLLTYYYERVYRFNNDHIDNTTLWKEIVQVNTAFYIFDAASIKKSLLYLCYIDLGFFF